MSHARTATGLMVATMALLGCGSSGGDYANDPRPPSPIDVSAAITPKGVSVSPKEFGAGPITITIANETDQAQSITVETDELAASTPGIKQSTGPVNPGGTATMKLDVTEGAYQVSASAGGINPAHVKVGAARESAQNQLLQP